VQAAIRDITNRCSCRGYACFERTLAVVVQWAGFGGAAQLHVRLKEIFTRSNGMSSRHEKATNYGNWVSNRIIATPAALAVIFAASSVLTLVLLVPAAILLLIAAYFAYARHLFSPAGGNVQEKVRNIVLENLIWDGNGKALDIGCGSAALTIEIAQKFPCSTVVGTDYWGGTGNTPKRYVRRMPDSSKLKTG